MTKARPLFEKLGKGVCGRCLKMRPLFRNPRGPIALCGACLTRRRPLHRTQEKDASNGR